MVAPFYARLAGMIGVLFISFPLVQSLFNGITDNPYAPSGPYFGLSSLHWSVIFGVLLYVGGIYYLQKSVAKIRPWFLVPTIFCYFPSMLILFFPSDFSFRIADTALLMAVLFGPFIIGIWGLIEIARIASY